MSNASLNNPVDMSTSGSSTTELSRMYNLIDNNSVPRVSFDEAISPLHISVPELEQMVSRVKSIGKTWLNTLTKDESHSILLYTMKWTPKEKSFNAILNTTLHKKNVTLLKPWLLYLKLIMTALSKFTPNSTHVTVYYAVKFNLISQYPLGRNFIWWSFSLCTSTLSSLNDDEIFGQTGPRTLFIIDSQSAKNIRNHSLYPHEIDILLPSACQFQVTGSFIAGNGLQIIHLKEIQSKNQLLPSIRRTSTDSKNSIVSQERFKIKTQNQRESLSPSSVTRSVNANEHSPSKSMRKKSIESVSDETKIPANISALLNHTDAKVRKLFANLFTNPMLTSLDLSRNHISEDEVKALSYALSQHKVLNTLDLQHNLITPQGALHLAKVLTETTSLTTINLENNHISDQGIQYFANALLTNKTLTTLNLRENRIRAQGIQYFSHALEQNQTLTKLNLRDNQIGNLGASYLANALKKNQTLTTLNLGHNRISGKGAQYFANALHINKTLATLDLECNEIGSLGAQYIANALQINKTLTVLNLKTNLVGIAEKRLILEISQRNPTLEIIL